MTDAAEVSIGTSRIAVRLPEFSLSEDPQLRAMLWPVRVIEAREPQLLSIPEALALGLGQPVRSWRQVEPVEKWAPPTARLALVECTPWGDVDPLFPVFLGDLGDVIFKALGQWYNHRLEIDEKGSIYTWYAEGRILILDISRRLQEAMQIVGLLEEEADWLVRVMKACLAEPNVPQGMCKTSLFTQAGVTSFLQSMGQMELLPQE